MHSLNNDLFTLTKCMQNNFKQVVFSKLRIVILSAESVNLYLIIINSTNFSELTSYREQ